MHRARPRIAALCTAIALAGCAAPAGPPREPVAPREDPAASRARDAALADAFERRADAHADLGQRELAAPLYERAIELRAAASDAHSEASALAALAVIQHDRDHLPEVEHFYRRALAAEQAGGGGDPALRTRVLANLGSLLRAVGRRKEALESLAGARERRGENSAELAWLLGESAATCAELGRTDEAADYYERALAVWERLQPESDAIVAETLANLALVHRARGEHAQASALLERAIPLFERDLGPGDPIVVRTRELLAASAASAKVRASAPASPTRD